MNITQLEQVDCMKFAYITSDEKCHKKLKYDRLEWICENENIELDSSAISELIELCDGDMRKSITALQVN